MSTPILQQVSAQIGQAIVDSGQITYLLRRNRVFSKGSGIPQVRGYTIPAAPGSGAGKGGGAGGSVRESGGSLGQYGAAHEEEFFYHKQREQLEKMKSKLKKEMAKSPNIAQKKEK